MKTIIFIVLLILCTFGALNYPVLGLYGFIADYCVGSAGSWWGRPLYHMGIRVSFSLAIFTVLGTALNWRKLRYGDRLLDHQENLMLIFMIFLWIGMLFSSGVASRYEVVDHPTIKITKIFIFVFFMTHVITDKRKFDGLLWVFVFVSLVLGLQAWDVPRSAYLNGRLEGVGGTGFREANYFAAFMATMMPIIGIQFFRYRNLIKRTFCAVSAAFTANTIVLCKSRGAFLGLVVGVLMAIFLAPKRFRMKLFVCIFIGILGCIYVSDPRFIDRVSTITDSADERDSSAQSRIDLWKAGVKMIIDKPFGIGPGEWYLKIGRYIPEYTGKDSHSTFVKCLSELGIQGFVVFLLIISVAYRSLSIDLKNSSDSNMLDQMHLIGYAVKLSLTILLVCSVTMTFIYADFFWIILSMPICYKRMVENYHIDNNLV